MFPQCLTVLYTCIDSIMIIIINIVKLFMLLSFVDDVDICLDNSYYSQSLCVTMMLCFIFTWVYTLLAIRQL